METISFHRAEISDALILADMRIQFIMDFAGKQPDEDIAVLRKHLTDYFSKEISAGKTVSYIARSAGKIAGTGTIVFREQPGHFRNPSGRVGYVMNMFTLPEFRKRGICTSILKLLIDEGVLAGISAFELHATKEGEPIYKNYGFMIHNEPTLRLYK